MQFLYAFDLHLIVYVTGKLMEVACRMLGAFGQDSRFTTCQ